jgi:hypothetical protein
VPLFGRGRKKEDKVQAPPSPVLDESAVQEFSLKLSYLAKSSEGVRLKAGPGAVARLPRLLDGFVEREPELIEPLPVEIGTAAPWITRLPAAAQWLQYHHKRSPITRHALQVLESVDAVDLAFETLVLGLLDGETDTAGYPEYNAIVGGVASHWDEMTGDIIARAVVGWGGKGVRGDTDRNANRLLAGLFGNLRGDPHAIGVVSADQRPSPTVGGGSGGIVCAHCGFDPGNERAFYCLKCGMRLLRQ